MGMPFTMRREDIKKMNTTAKKKKSVVLEKGQRIWISSENLLSKKEPTLFECEVVRANGTSAYVIRVEDKSNYSRYEWRILQRSLTVDDKIMSFIKQKVWLSESDFRDNEEHLRLLQEARSKADKLVNKMTLKELEEMIERYGKD
ncbi:hypothetical protein ACQR3P_29240 [Rhodococcus sp. IEGM1300]